MGQLKSEKYKPLDDLKRTKKWLLRTQKRGKCDTSSAATIEARKEKETRKKSTEV